MTEKKAKDVRVQLSGEDGNAFAIIGRTVRALQRAGFEAEAKEYEAAAFESESYDALLQLTMRTVTVG